MTVMQIERMIEKLPRKQQVGLARWLDARTWQKRLMVAVARMRTRAGSKVRASDIRRLAEEVRQARHDSGRS
jgi:hypothetical protein